MQKSKQETMHLFAKNPSEESVVGRIKNWTEKIKKLQVRVRFVVGDGDGARLGSTLVECQLIGFCRDAYQLPTLVNVLGTNLEVSCARQVISFLWFMAHFVPRFFNRFCAIIPPVPQERTWVGTTNCFVRVCFILCFVLPDRHSGSR